MGDTTEHIARIPPKRRREAARLMASASGEPDSGDRFLEATRAHGVGLDEFWGIADAPDGPLEAVTLLVPSPGSTFMVFTSPVRDEEDADHVSRLLATACQGAQGANLAQALLETGDSFSRAAFVRAGFQFVGELLYLRRPWSPISGAGADWPEGVTIEPWRDGLDDDLARALDRSYIDTLDCPELCGVRDTRDVIESHRATGQFDPTLWWIVRLDQQPAGALLLNPSPPLDHTELVYIGLGPELRGKGLSRGLLRFGLASLADRAHRTVACAVDARNLPARKLYEREHFREFSRRIAFVLPLGRDHAG